MCPSPCTPSPHLYRHLRRGTAPPGRPPATQHLHHDLRRVKTWPRHDSAPNGGGAGDTEGANSWACKVHPPFLKFLLFTHYSSPTCRTQKTRHTVTFSMFGGSPAPALSPPPGHEKHARHTCFSCSAAPLPLPSSPCSPTQGMCPCGHVLCARLPPHPYLPPPPPPGHEQHAHVTCFSCSAALIPQPSC